MFNRPTLATLIQRLRKHHGWSTKLLAERSALSRTTIVNCEGGDESAKKPHPRSIAKVLCALLDLPSAKLSIEDAIEVCKGFDLIPILIAVRESISNSDPEFDLLGRLVSLCHKRASVRKTDVLAHGTQANDQSDSGTIVDNRNVELDYVSLASKSFPNVDYYPDWHKQKELLDVSTRAFEIAHRLQLRSRNSAELFYKSGWLAREHGLFKKAEDHLQFAIETARIIGEASIESFALTELGNLLNCQRKWDQAKSVYSRALDLRTQLDLDSEWIAQSHCNLGNNFMDQGEYYQAKQHIERSLMYWSTDIERNRSEYAWGVLTLGCLGLKQGKIVDALVHCNSGLSIKSLELGADHPLCCYFTNKIAECKMHLGEIRDADRLSDMACSEWRTSYGSEHPLLASFAFTRGKILAKKGRIEEARDLCKRSQEIEYCSNPESKRLTEIADFLAELA